MKRLGKAGLHMASGVEADQYPGGGKALGLSSRLNLPCAGAFMPLTFWLTAFNKLADFRFDLIDTISGP